MQCSYVQDALSKKTVKTWVFYGKAILNCDSGTILAQGSILIGHTATITVLNLRYLDSLY